MHAGDGEELTDSMKMFRWGVEGGRPAPGQIGTAPEWFYKGTGTTLRAHGEPLEIPVLCRRRRRRSGDCRHLSDCCRMDRRTAIGMAGGNEFSDHRFEKKNYLNLAGSKLRTCALGPELVVDPEFRSVSVAVNIERDGGSALVNKVPHRRSRNVPQPAEY